MYWFIAGLIVGVAFHWLINRKTLLLGKMLLEKVGGDIHAATLHVLSYVEHPNV